jgi:hypothetical protein
MRSTCRLASLFLAFTPARTNPRAEEHEMLLHLAAEHRSEPEAFQAEQAAFASRTSLPETREFPGLGTLNVNQAALVGRPGKAFVRVRFTFVNTSAIGFEGPRVSLRVRDPSSGESWSESLEMQAPVGIHPNKESSYSAALKTPTRGVEFEAGWGWEIVLEARADP